MFRKFHLDITNKHLKLCDTITTIRWRWVDYRNCPKYIDRIKALMVFFSFNFYFHYSEHNLNSFRSLYISGHHQKKISLNWNVNTQEKTTEPKWIGKSNKYNFFRVLETKNIHKKNNNNNDHQNEFSYCRHMKNCHWQLFR